LLLNIAGQIYKNPKLDIQRQYSIINFETFTSIIIDPLQEAQGACGAHLVLKSIGLCGFFFLSTKFYIRVYLVLAIMEQFKIPYICKRELYCLKDAPFQM